MKRGAVSLFLTLCLLLSAPWVASGDPSGSFPQGNYPFIVEVAGEGPAILFIPGLTCSGSLWNATVEELGTTYRCHVLTLAGFAGQKPIGDPFLSVVCDGIIRYIRDEGLDHPVLIGHSLGGFLSYWVAATAPSLVGPIVAVDAVPFTPALSLSGATVDDVRTMAASLRDRFASTPIERFPEQNRIYLSAMMKSRKDLDFVTEMSGRSNPEATGLALYEMLTTDIRAELPEICSRVLLLAAGDVAPADSLARSLRETYAREVAAIPRHEVVVVPNARHFIMLDQPDFFVARVRQFLSRPTTDDTGCRDRAADRRGAGTGTPRSERRDTTSTSSARQ